MVRRLALVAAVVAAVILGSTPAPAVAITDGQLDGNGHPYVGLMVFQLPNPDVTKPPLRFRCSGTLLSRTVFLSAGHCTFGVIGKVQLWLDADVETHRCGVDLLPANVAFTAANCATYIADWNGYPFIGEFTGDAHAIPSYDDAHFFLHDIGVVVLDSPVPTSVTSTYGALPALNASDALKSGAKTRFTSVGYGLQQAYPDTASFLTQGLRVREVAHPYLLQVNTPFTGPGSLLLSNNAYSGGTCFGDSGGPNFYGTFNVVAAVTSFGLNSTCGGTGGVFRVDRADVLGFINSYLNP